MSIEPLTELPWIPLPPGFVLGASTSAYQIEGAPDADGKGPSIWDRFAHTPGRTAGGATGDVACDHYRRWQADLDLLAALGLPAYRFSVSWPRIFPTGRETRPNPLGLDHYDRLVDGLLERGIDPWLTLYHWDLPQGLEDRGGWLSRDTVGAFRRLVEAVHGRVGDRVKNWGTINEPFVLAFLGYANGLHAPGKSRAVGDYLAASHHALLAHGEALAVLEGANAGITLNLIPSYPASYEPLDVRKARWEDGFFNRWYLDPLHGRGYPEEMIGEYVDNGWLSEPRLSFVQPGDMERIARPAGYLGVNFYSRSLARDPLQEQVPGPKRVLPEPPAGISTDMEWEMSADALRDLLLRLHTDYEVPSLVITESGAAFDTPPNEAGEVPDLRRVSYLAEHLRACQQARDAGVPLDGYFVWSLFDNFEWNEGYGKRFGIVWVDFETQQRIPKDSARFLVEVIRRHAVPV